MPDKCHGFYLAHISTEASRSLPAGATCSDALYPVGDSRNLLSRRSCSVGDFEGGFEFVFSTPYKLFKHGDQDTSDAFLNVHIQYTMRLSCCSHALFTWHKVSERPRVSANYYLIEPYFVNLKYDLPVHPVMVKPDYVEEGCLLTLILPQFSTTHLGSSAIDYD